MIPHYLVEHGWIYLARNWSGSFGLTLTAVAR
jgi:hypothetical protein